LYLIKIKYSRLDGGSLERGHVVRPPVGRSSARYRGGPQRHARVTSHHQVVDELNSCPGRGGGVIDGGLGRIGQVRCESDGI